MTIIQRAWRRAARAGRKWYRLRRAARLGIRYVPPNFIYRASIGPDDIVLDVGCAAEADFSVHMICTHAVRAFGIDPTRKHAPALARLEQQLAGRFRHVPLAIAARNGTELFHESDKNVSGSLLQDHTNILHDSVRSYEVKTTTLPELLRKLGIERVALLKLDLEGAEYELLGDIDADTLDPFDQLFVEFHHHAIRRYTAEDTWRIVRAIERLGMNVFSVDDHNFLFYRTTAAH